MTFYRINASEGVPKKRRGRPKKIDSGIIQAEIKAVKEQVMKNPFANLKGTLPEKESTNEDIYEQIKAIQSEKIPPSRDTVNGRKSWDFDQNKRIKELKSKLKNQ